MDNSERLFLQSEIIKSESLIEAYKEQMDAQRGTYIYHILLTPVQMRDFHNIVKNYQRDTIEKLYTLGIGSNADANT